MHSQVVTPMYADFNPAGRWEHVKAYLTYTIGLLTVAKFYSWLSLSKSQEQQNTHNRYVEQQLSEIKANLRIPSSAKLVISSVAQHATTPIIPDTGVEVAKLKAEILRLQSQHEVAARGSHHEAEQSAAKWNEEKERITAAHQDQVQLLERIIRDSTKKIENMETKVLEAQKHYTDIAVQAESDHSDEILKLVEERKEMIKELTQAAVDAEGDRISNIQESRADVEQECRQKYQAEFDAQKTHLIQGHDLELESVKKTLKTALEEKNQITQSLEKHGSQLLDTKTSYHEHLRKKDEALMSLRKQLQDQVKHALQFKTTAEGHQKSVTEMGLQLKIVQDKYSELQYSKELEDDHEALVQSQLVKANAKLEGSSDRIRAKDEEIRILGEELEAEKMRRAQVEIAKDKETKTLEEALKAEKLRRKQVEDDAAKSMSEKSKALEAKQTLIKTSKQLTASEKRNQELESSLSQKDVELQAKSRELEEAHTATGQNLKNLEAELSRKKEDLSSQHQTDLQGMRDELNNANEYARKQSEEKARLEEDLAKATKFRDETFPHLQAMVKNSREKETRRDAHLKERSDETAKLQIEVTELEAINKKLIGELAAKQRETDALRKSHQKEALMKRKEDTTSYQQIAGNVSIVGTDDGAGASGTVGSDESTKLDAPVAPQAVQVHSASDAGVTSIKSVAPDRLDTIGDSSVRASGMGKSKYAPAEVKAPLDLQTNLKDVKADKSAGTKSHMFPMNAFQHHTLGSGPSTPTSSAVPASQALEWDPPTKPDNFNTKTHKICRRCSRVFYTADYQSRASFQKHIIDCQKLYITCGNESCGKVMSTDHFYYNHRARCKMTTLEQGREVYDIKGIRDMKDARNEERIKSEKSNQKNKQVLEGQPTQAAPVPSGSSSRPSTPSAVHTPKSTTSIPDTTTSFSTAKLTSNAPAIPAKTSFPTSKGGLGGSRYASSQPSITRQPPVPGPQSLQELSEINARQRESLSAFSGSSRPSTPLSTPTPTAPTAPPGPKASTPSAPQQATPTLTSPSAPAALPTVQKPIDDPNWQVDGIATFSPEVSYTYDIHNAYIGDQAAFRKTIQCMCMSCKKRVELPWRISPNEQYYLLSWDEHLPTCTATKGK